MKEFQGKDYLLHSDFALGLYEEFAKDMPIFDFHCHLNPKQIYEDHKFSSITEAWLGKDGAGDHYKWRLLREAGVPEELITGNADDHERFLAFAKAMPSFFGNPIYEWTHLELKRYFGIDLVINEENAEKIWAECNKQLETMTARKMVEMSNVSLVFTTDDPADDLHYHDLIAKDTSFKTRVLPCWRPDRYLHIANGEIFRKAMGQLEERIGKRITSLDELLEALKQRLDFFAEKGAKATDHGLDTLRYSRIDKKVAEQAFLKGLKGEALTEDELDCYESYLLVFLGKEYRRLGFVQQYHIGAIRNNTEVGYKLHGVDFGYDACGDINIADKLAKLLSELEKQDALPPTVLYCLNEKDYCSMVTLMNVFQGKGKGYIQLGAAWWFNDHYDGIRKQIKVLMAGGLLSCFVGMLTDSRSFLSYPRHEYFRRLLVDEISLVVEDGRYPNDRKAIGKIIQDVCYNNAIEFFLNK
ncbi:MAG: glucuronate isomerase [Bacilli bacterium]|nr:glucuronate isomerase [Bacilli bacterium]